MTGLHPRKELFAIEYLRTGALKASAIAAGYSPTSASKTATRLLKDPYVVEFMDAARERSLAVAQYGATEAMRELEAGMRFARETKNATALARLIELRMKHAGLLVDRSDVRMLGGFRIEIAGIGDGSTVAAAAPIASAAAAYAVDIADPFK